MVEITASDGMFRAGDVVINESDTLAVLDGRIDRVDVRLPTDTNGPCGRKTWGCRLAPRSRSDWDLLLLLRGDTRTLEARDPVTFELRGQVALPDEVGWSTA
ncbi:MAG: hypothetical protein WBO43_10190 [Gemmatimonadota bacterium]